MLSIYCSSFYYLIEYSHKSGREGGNEMEVDVRGKVILQPQGKEFFT